MRKKLLSTFAILAIIATLAGCAPKATWLPLLSTPMPGRTSSVTNEPDVSAAPGENGEAAADQWFAKDVEKMDNPKIIVTKSSHTLEVWDGETLMARMKVALGRGGDGPKLKAGDNLTPEGDYYICKTNDQGGKFYKSLFISYPNAEDANAGLINHIINQEQCDDITKAIENRKQPPWDTDLGSEIAINGIGTGGVDKSGDWTAGNIAVSDKDMDYVRLIRPGSDIRLRDVAREAGVHIATASRALNPADPRPGPSPDRGQGRRRRRSDWATRSTSRPRTLRTQRSEMIGVLIPDISRPLYPPMMRGIVDVLEEHGYSALLSATDEDEARERRLVSSLRARGVDGFILATAHVRHPLLEDAATLGVPTVTLNRTATDAPVSSVAPDNEAGMADIAAHLAAFGHEHIAHIAGPSDTSTGRARTAGLDARPGAAGADHPRRAVGGDRDLLHREGVRAARRLLMAGQPFTAIVTGNDLLALGALDVLRESRIRCPEQVSVTGFNDLPMMDRVTPALTTVRVPQYEMGREAARLLVEQLEGAPEVQHLVLPVELVVRDSTTQPPDRGADGRAGGRPRGVVRARRPGAWRPSRCASPRSLAHRPSGPAVRLRSRRGVGTVPEPPFPGPSRPARRVERPGTRSVSALGCQAAQDPLAGATHPAGRVAGRPGLRPCCNQLRRKPTTGHFGETRPSTIMVAQWIASMYPARSCPMTRRHAQEDLKDGAAGSDRPRAVDRGAPRRRSSPRSATRWCTRTASSR